MCLQYTTGDAMDASGLERMYSDMMNGALVLPWVPQDFKDKWRQQLQPNLSAVVQRIVEAIQPAQAGTLTRQEFEAGFVRVLDTRA